MSSEFVHQPTIESVQQKMNDSAPNLWEALFRVSVNQLNKLSVALDEVAPTPGYLVYLEIKRSSYQFNDHEPYLFTALDTCTHLQLARYYLTGSAASGVDFLEYLSLNFPFKIREVCTKADTCFTSSSMPQSFHRFTNACVNHGILHTVTTDRQQHQAASLLSSLTFSGIFEGSVNIYSQSSLMKELEHFLLFYNNHRSMPTLGGKTPVEKLRTFEGFDHILMFDPSHNIPQVSEQ